MIISYNLSDVVAVSIDVLVEAGVGVGDRQRDFRHDVP
jgi:hypothetical protein